MSKPPLLNYASPPSAAPAEVHRDPVNFHLTLPPISNRLFVVMMTPYIIGPLALIALLAWLFLATGDREGTVWMLVSGYVIIMTFMVVRLARYRQVERTVGATPFHVYYSDARTAGAPAALFRRDLADIRVRRGPFRPWIWELVAVPPRRIFVVSSNVPLEPIVLLFGLDRATLERVAADLRAVCPVPARKADAPIVDTISLRSS